MISRIFQNLRKKGFSNFPSFQVSLYSRAFIIYKIHQKKKKKNFRQILLIKKVVMERKTAL